MLIQLRQTEIEAALQMYIAHQGISLVGKSVDISFTSGRKDNGMSADIDIIDLDPGFARTLVQQLSSGQVGCDEPKQAAAPKACSVEAEAPVQEEECAEADAEPVVEEQEEAKTTSLFG